MKKLLLLLILAVFIFLPNFSYAQDIACEVKQQQPDLDGCISTDCPFAIVNSTERDECEEICKNEDFNYCYNNSCASLNLNTPEQKECDDACKRTIEENKNICFKVKSDIAAQAIAAEEAAAKTQAPPPAAAQGPVTLTNPLGETDVRLLIARVVKGAISVSGSLAFLMIFYGGILWLTAAGRPEPIKKGKDIFVWSILGIAVIASAYVITNAIFSALLTGSVG